MSEKVNYNSSSVSIQNAIGEEYPKAIRWLEKHKAKKEWRDGLDKVMSLIKSGKEKELNCKHVIYNAQSGNVWLLDEIITTKVPNPEGEPISCCRCALIFGFTEKYLWTIVVGTGDTTIKGYTAIVFSPHFFMRFSQRVGFEINDRMKTLLNFIRVTNYLHYDYFSDIKSGNKYKNCKKVHGSIPGCLFFGVIDRYNVMRFNTVIPDSQLCSNKQRTTSDFRKNVNAVLSGKRDSLLSEAFMHARPCRWFIHQAKAQQFSRAMIIKVLRHISCEIIIRYTLYNYCEFAKVLLNVTSDQSCECYDTILKSMESSGKEYRFEEYEPSLRKLLSKVVPNCVPVFVEQIMHKIRSQCTDISVPFDMFYLEMWGKRAIQKNTKNLPKI